MNHSFLPFACLGNAFLLCCLISCSSAEEPSIGATADQVVAIWSNNMPEWNAPSEDERDTTGEDGRTVADQRVSRLGFVSTPQLHVFHAKNSEGEKVGSETAVMICPGGGYSILAWDLEGTEIAQWLSGLGVTAIVVKYRVPTRSEDSKWLPPVQDIQRAISLVRSGGVEGVEVKRVGVLGFSAGGNASARTALAPQRHYEATDKHDQASPTPDFAVLVYPAWLNQAGTTELTEELSVTENSPPMFFAHAADDRISALGSLAVYAALHRQKIASELHVFASGGHGFGGRIAGKPTDAWRDLCGTWMKNQGWIE